MKIGYRALLIIVLLHCFTLSERTSLGQGEQDATTSAKWMQEANFRFSISRREDVKRLATVRDIGVLEATLVLERFTRQEYTNDDDEAKLAVEVLVKSGGGGRRAIAALCQNVLTLKSNRGDETVPLSDFVAAQALVAIGGRPARAAVFDSLRQPLEARDLLIRAHVLALMEPRSIMREYLRLALEDQVERERVRGIAINENYKKNLRLIDERLRDPDFLTNPKNWP